ncbi:MAG: hypothetical protein JWL90_2545 [Chthoniobacteraceae bacterium]|nr:hypothetical protein [Chthoniobacteraceae bacterium]
MNLPACRLASLLLAAVVLAGCGKKKAANSEKPEAAPVAQSVPGAAPAEPHPKGTDLSVAPPESLSSQELSDGTPSATGTSQDAATAGVPDKLLVNDQAYDAWFKKHRLDLNDPKMLDRDTDGDGATNREEFVADTDPRDPKSRPGIHKVIRLKEYSEVRVPLILESVAGRTAKIKRTDEGGDSKFDSVTVGQSVGGMRVEKILVRHETDKNGQAVDLSRVDLEDPATKAKVVLVKDMPARSAASYAVLTAGSGVTMKVHQGDVFNWPAQNGTAYQVIDLRADQVVIQEVETQRVWTIPK